MASSALFGQPAANAQDCDIMKGLAEAMGLPKEYVQCDQGLPLPGKPTGPSPPGHNPASVIAGLSVAIALVILITGARVWLRLFRRDLKVGLDDVFIIIAAMMVCVWFAISIAMAKVGGMGKHVYAVTYYEFYWFLRFAAIDTVLFWPTVGLTAMSITLFNRRLTGLTSTRWQYAHLTFLALLVVYIIIATFLNIFVCRPGTVDFSLIEIGQSTEPLKCMDRNSLGIALSAIHIAVQFCLLAVPLVILYIIKMSLGKKLRLAFLFSLGSVACIGAVMRQVLQKQNNPDVTFVFVKQLQWTIVDLFFTVITASLPVLNAAIPARWLSPANTMPQLPTISVLQRSRAGRGSVRLNSNKSYTRPDGTAEDVMPSTSSSGGGDPEHGLMEKDSFTRKTEERWDQAYEHSQKNGQVQSGSGDSSS